MTAPSARLGDKVTAGPAQEAIQDAGGVAPGKGKGRAGGAFGKLGQANRKPGNSAAEGGGGGGAKPRSKIADVGRDTRAARKRK